MKNWIYVFFLSVIFSTGISFCATGCSFKKVDSEEITMNFYPPKKSASEVAYLEQVPQPHELIGYVTVNTERNQKLTDILELMKREAAILGGDAVVNIQVNSSGFWKKLPPQQLLGNAYLRANYKADIIAYQ